MTRRQTSRGITVADLAAFRRGKDETVRRAIAREASLRPKPGRALRGRRCLPTGRAATAATRSDTESAPARPRASTARRENTRAERRSWGQLLLNIIRKLRAKSSVGESGAAKIFTTGSTEEHGGKNTGQSGGL